MRVAGVALGLSLLFGAAASGLGADTGWIAFVSDRDGISAVYAVRPDGTGLRRLLPNANEPRWSPDGAKLAFTRDDGLHVLEIRTGRVTVVDRRSVLFDSFSWSPDGRRIVYGLVEPAQGLWLASLDDGQRQRLTTQRDSGPVWSPQGDRILLERDGVGLVAIDLTGAELRRFGAVAVGGARVWSLNGKEVAFAREVGAFGEPSVFVASATGGAARRLIRGKGFELGLAWSPDGRTLAVSGLDGAVLALYARSGARRRVLLHEGYPSSPVWAPDGRSVVAGVGTDLWLFPVDGHRARALTHGARFNYQNDSPTWARLPVAALRGTVVRRGIETDSQLHGNVLWTKSRVDFLAADGSRAAVAYVTRPHCLELWDVPARRLVRFAENACYSLALGGEARGITGLALAGRRLAWEVYMETNNDNQWVSTASADDQRIRTPYEAETNRESLGTIAGGGRTLVFESVKPLRRRFIRVLGAISKTVVSVRGTGLLAASDGGILRRADARTLELLRVDGRLVRRINVGTTVEDAALAGGQVAIRGDRVLEIRSTRTSALIHRLVLPTAMRLEGYAGGVAALADRRRILVVRPRDGARVDLRIPGPADGTVFTRSGLFYAYAAAGRFKGRVAYVPLRELAQRLR